MSYWQPGTGNSVSEWVFGIVDLIMHLGSKEMGAELRQLQYGDISHNEGHHLKEQQLMTANRILLCMK